MNHIAVQCMGIIAFLMINSSRQMNRQGKQSSNSKIEQRSQAIDRLKAASAKFTYIIENELWDQAGNVAESTSNLNIVVPMPLSKWRASCDKEMKWFETKGSRQDVTSADLNKHADIFEKLLNSDQLTETSTSSSTPTNWRNRNEVIEAASAALGALQLNQALEQQEIEKLYEGYANEFKEIIADLKHDIAELERGDLMQHGKTKGAAHESLSAISTSTRNENISSSSKKKKGTKLREKPPIKINEDKFQDELSTPSTRLDGPTATASNKNTNSRNKNKGRKKTNWRH